MKKIENSLENDEEKKELLSSSFKNLKYIMAICIALVLITLIGIIIYRNSGVRKFSSKFENNDYISAQEYYEVTTEQEKNKIEEFIVSYVNEVEELYINKECSYERYIELSEASMSILGQNEILLESKSNVDNVYLQREIFEKGKNQFLNHDYVESILTLLTVDEKAEDYNEAQDMIDNARKLCKKQVVEKIAKYLYERKFEEALDYIESMRGVFSEEDYEYYLNETKSIVDEFNYKQLNINKLGLLKNQLLNIRTAKNLLYVDFYVNEVEHIYGLLTITDEDCVYYISDNGKNLKKIFDEKPPIETGIKEKWISFDNSSDEIRILVGSDSDINTNLKYYDFTEKVTVAEFIKDDSDEDGEFLYYINGIEVEEKEFNEINNVKYAIFDGVGDKIVWIDNGSEEIDIHNSPENFMTIENTLEKINIMINN